MVYNFKTAGVVRCLAKVNMQVDGEGKEEGGGGGGGGGGGEECDPRAYSTIMGGGKIWVRKTRVRIFSEL